MGHMTLDRNGKHSLQSLRAGAAFTGPVATELSSLTLRVSLIYFRRGFVVDLFSANRSWTSNRDSNLEPFDLTLPFGGGGQKSQIKGFEISNRYHSAGEPAEPVSDNFSSNSSMQTFNFALKLTLFYT